MLGGAAARTAPVPAAEMSFRRLSLFPTLIDYFMLNPMATMKAVRFHSYGAPEVLVYEDAPKPEPAAGEVLVKVHATSVNPIDWKIRAGQLRSLREYPLPLILGWDVSGIV